MLSYHKLKSMAVAAESVPPLLELVIICILVDSCGRLKGIRSYGIRHDKIVSVDIDEDVSRVKTGVD